MMRYRAMLKKQEPTATVAVQHNRIQELLTEATTLLDRTRLPAGAAFLSAFLILLQEGLEAVLVLAAILALADQKRATRCSALCPRRLDRGAGSRRMHLVHHLVCHRVEWLDT